MTEIRHTGFFSEGFEFDRRSKAELQRHGIRAEVAEAIETHIDFLIAFYKTNPPTKRAQHQHYQDADDALSNAASVLDRFDDLTLDTLEAAVFRSRGYIAPADLLRSLRAYANAAKTLAIRSRPKRGPDASKSDHVALLVGQTLLSAGIPIDDSLKGPFSIALQIALGAMRIGMADPRACIQRALKKLNPATS